MTSLSFLVHSTSILKPRANKPFFKKLYLIDAGSLSAWMSFRLKQQSLQPFECPTYPEPLGLKPQIPHDQPSFLYFGNVKISGDLLSSTFSYQPLLSMFFFFFFPSCSWLSEFRVSLNPYFLTATLCNPSPCSLLPVSKHTESTSTTCLSGPYFLAFRDHYHFAIISVLSPLYSQIQ